MNDWPMPFWIAHRGAGKRAPENTLAAFRTGAAHGYRAFECDVKTSVDGVPFLLHDDTLDRTTGIAGLAGDRSWADLSRMDAGAWHSPGFAGEPIPCLDAIAAFIRGNGLGLNIEIKPTPGQEACTGQAVGQAALRLWGAAPEQLLFSSFRPEALSGARHSAPMVPRALLLDRPWPDWWQVAQSLGCVAVITNHRLMDADMADKLHGAGMRALCYTVNETEDAERLLRVGVDGLITDAIDRFPPAFGGVKGGLRPIHVGGLGL
jgi:glycerophosphoryl diester phosphodiesterase